MRLGRLYFGVQALAGAAWWVAVFASDIVREATLGGLDPAWVAAFDVPLFVVASAIAAAGIRWAIWTATIWTLIVTGALALYATVTGEAGWGALLMIAASGASVAAALLALTGRLPTEWVIRGPFRFRKASVASPTRYFVWTLGQIAVFWSLFLGVIPVILAFVEWRWRLNVPVPGWLQPAGIALLVLFSALGLWAAFAMSTRGDGTPLPVAMPKRLVTSGPYRFVRNPMALAGIAQGVAVGLILGSWLVVVYALLGSMVWNWVVRPHEEANLIEEFGDEYRVYQGRVRCWVPALPGWTSTPTG